MNRIQCEWKGCVKRAVEINSERPGFCQEHTDMLLQRFKSLYKQMENREGRNEN